MWKRHRSAKHLLAGIACWSAGMCAVSAPVIPAGATLDPAQVALPADYAAPSRKTIDAILGAALTPKPAPRLRHLRVVLCASGRDEGHLDPGMHDYPLWRERWSQLLSRADGVSVETADGWPNTEQWRSADLIVINSYNPAWALEKAGSRQIVKLAHDIDTFLARGGGLVFLHYALNAGVNGDALAARLGLAWVSPPASFRHGANDWQLDETHPLAAGLHEFKVPDESYWNLTGSLDAVGARILMRSVDDGASHPEMWTREVGKGRVFVSIPGHYAYTFDDPLYRILIFRGMMWSAREPIDRLAPLVLVGARVASEPTVAADPPGKVLFESHCAVCHDRGAAGAPPTLTLGMLGVRTIHEALTSGRMRAQGQALSGGERRTLAEYLSGQKLDASLGRAPKACEPQKRWFEARNRAVGIGWGIDAENTRLIPATEAGLSAADVPSLQLKWALAFPGASHAIAQPLVAGSGLFVGSADGTVRALDARTGCEHWAFKATAEVLGGIVIESTEHPHLFFADRLAYVYALDAASGKLAWRVRADAHPSATIMGTPVLRAGRLLVPVISFEENAGGANYPCCTFRGSLVAMEAVTGKSVWKRYTIPHPPVEQFKNALGVPQFAPSGAGIWSAPTVDAKRGLIYFTTGNSYSEPTDDSTDAVFAIDLASGEPKWHTQTLAGDAWVMWDYLCHHESERASQPGCPGLKHPGPDIDFTTSPVLVHGRDGKDILVAGRKDGTTFGLDPAAGRILWSTRTSRNPDPNAGALNFGLMAEGETVFMPSVGTNFPNAASFVPTEDDGLYALDAFTGEQRWAAKVSKDCDRPTPCTGLSAAPIGFPGVVFAGATDGYVRAYDSASGKVIWHFDTAREFSTLNGEVAHGGAIGRNSIMIAGGVVYVGSGYSRLPGNVLLAFAPGTPP